jgi:hypothetical protein
MASATGQSLQSSCAALGLLTSTSGETYCRGYNERHNG